MKDFYTWLQVENLGNFLPNLGQRAIPVGQQPAQPKQVKLSDLAAQVQNPDWHFLYDVFGRQFSRAPQDPKVAGLGQALYQAAQSGDFSRLAPYKQQHLQAQRL